MGANTREIRSRIKSVKNTQQITKAMQMVAAAKVRRAQERVTAAKPFSKAIAEMYAQLSEQLPAGEYNNPLLSVRDVKTVLLVVMSSDKGLCGGFNANIIRLATQRAKFYQAEGKTVKWVLVGQKATNAFRSMGDAILTNYTQLPQIPTFTEAQELVRELSNYYSNGTVDKIELINTTFQSLMTQTPTTSTFLPAEKPAKASDAKATAQAQCLFEPSAEEVMDRLVPKYLETVIFQALLESAASELAARMTAMSAASNNAKELIKALSLVYNKARQAAITQEILEVVGGASAL
jgi:F-type H+-transporting ATPase subunit gamma